MAGRPSHGMVEAMKLVLAGVTPYAAAKRMQIALNTMYRSPLYKLWLAGEHDALRQKLDPTRPRPRHAVK